MSAPDITLLMPARRAYIQRWRRRSRVIAALRILLPGLIGLILASLVGTVVYNSVIAPPPLATAADDPIKLVNPRFVGRDDRGRAFILIAKTATRDPKEFQRVFLDQPALVLDEQGPDPLRITAAKGIYMENDKKLAVSGGVRLTGTQAIFDTAASLFDTRTGELVGSGPIQGSGPLGEINSKSYGVYDKGNRMVFTGGVHTRMNSK